MVLSSAGGDRALLSVPTYAREGVYANPLSTIQCVDGDAPVSPDSKKGTRWYNGKYTYLFTCAAVGLIVLVVGVLMWATILRKGDSRSPAILGQVGAI
ncbi:hypothetical protein KIPB_013816 [Kipferlia bialata]|uniref:Uncharacterized protein n=1 Tax=Kipferlia bialata TaxID=797122 RepID=A0A391NUQ3_9EUKA|nr:hypothetical protein KIPB_013816 [Kipferlia bialata]|eukprot:g13816.t1